MKNKIRLTSTGHFVLGVDLALIIYIILFHVASYFQSAHYRQDDESVLALWFFFWFISLIYSLGSIFMLSLEWDDPIILNKITGRRWYHVFVFVQFHFLYIWILSVPWKDLRLIEVVEE